MMIVLISEANPMKSVREINKNQQTAARMAASMAGIAARRKYSEKERANALAADGGNLNHTTKQLGIPEKTLGNWAKDERRCCRV